MNCPFYGRQLFSAVIPRERVPFLLFDSKGNQCGLVGNAHVCCYREEAGEPIEWSDCLRVLEIRAEQKI